MEIVIDLSALSQRDQMYQAGSLIGSIHYGATAKREYISKIMAEIQEMNSEANRGSDPAKHAENLMKKMDRVDEAEEVESIMLGILRQLAEQYLETFEEEWKPRGKSTACVDEVQKRLQAKLAQHGKPETQTDVPGNEAETIDEDDANDE